MLLLIVGLLAVYFATAVAAEPGSSWDMTLETNAKQAAFVATSVTAWLGWRLVVDCENAALLPHNCVGLTAHG